jgi:hypothetical protein
MRPTVRRSLGGLVSELGSGMATLFRNEIQLARTETSEKISQAGMAIAAIAAAGILALAALLVLLEALVIAITEAGLPPAVSAAIVGAVVAGVAYGLLHKGLRDLRASHLAPTHTIDALRRSAHGAEEQAR